MIRRLAAGDYAPYAGIGSRETPDDILVLMATVAERLGALGYTLRSGGADGADTAFMQGAGVYPMEIYTPWRGFIKNRSMDARATVVTEQAAYAQALERAQQAHPRWDACTPGARKLHARNVMQIYGRDLLELSRFVVCWTKNGAASGGTGQALRLAHAAGVEVFNLKRDEDLRDLLAQLDAAEALALG